MDTLLLDYKLKTYGVTREALCAAMGWSESTRQARCIRGENWLVREIDILFRIGFTNDDIFAIFFRRKDHKSGQSKEEVQL